MVTLYEDFSAAIKRNDLFHAVKRIRAAIDSIAQEHDEIDRLHGQLCQHLSQCVRLAMNVTDSVYHAGLSK